MAAMIWDSASQAFVETTNAPMCYDSASDAFVETAGLVWDPEVQAWTEAWGQKVSSYVYGAALETITIKKNGIIVANASTNASGMSDEQISLAHGTYTLTGSVSGHTEEQMVDKDTTRFRAMPEGALYWYGNISSLLGGFECKLTQSGYTISSGTVNTNNLYVNSAGGWKNCSCLNSVNMIDISSFSMCHIISDGGDHEREKSGATVWLYKDLNHAWSYDQGAFFKGVNDNKVSQYDCDITDYNYHAYVGFATADVATRYGYLYALWLD